jgi:hypothetical protein
MACPARFAPPTVMSCSADAFSRRTRPGSKLRSIRVLAVAGVVSVPENTIFSAACQMTANSRETSPWPGCVRTSSAQYRIVSYIPRPYR